MKITKDAITFEKEEFEQFIGAKICGTCAHMLPLPKWAYDKNTCPECKDFPRWYGQFGPEN